MEPNPVFEHCTFVEKYAEISRSFLVFFPFGDGNWWVKGRELAPKVATQRIGLLSPKSRVLFNRILVGKNFFFAVLGLVALCFLWVGGVPNPCGVLISLKGHQ